MASSGWRSKQGSLDLLKGKKWKSYLFKVTGSTYLHYFADSKVAVPKEQIFLSTVKTVEVPSKTPKGGDYVFEVKHSGKNSPWVLNAQTEEDRNEWMEAILPNSTVKLFKAQSRDSLVATPSPPSQAHQFVSPRHNGTMPHPLLTHQDTNFSLGPPMPHPPAVMPRPHQDMTSSLGPPMPQPRPPGVMPRPHQDMTSSLGPPMPQPRPELTPLQFSPSHPSEQSSNQVRPPMPQPRPHQLPTTPAEYLDPLQLNMPTPSDPPKSPPPTTPPSQPLSSPRRFSDDKSDQKMIPNGNTYLIMTTSRDGKPADSTSCPVGENRYLPLQQVCRDPETPPRFPGEVSDGPRDEVVEALKSQFTSSQISMLVEMLTKMQTTDGQSKSSNNLSYLVTKTADTLKDSILVTEEDDPDSYDKRPTWAKAIYEEQMSINLSASSSSSLLKDLASSHIPRTALSNMKKIGAGQFGEVYSALYCPEGFTAQDAIKVAVKTAKKDCDEQQKKDMLREIAVMAKMVHPNIVRLYGIIQEEAGQIPWLVLEFLPYGDLKDYLKKSPKKSTDTLVKYMVDVAMGMHYIAERGLVHRDLAARNVLVGEGELCKVADFGLLRELPEDDSIYVSSSNVPCPIRWMPPEAIAKRSFSVASDVWSFGILQWEMLNPGKLPYSTFNNYELISKISNGYRMPSPRGCPPVVARIMKACWHADPAKRPSFLIITTLLTTKISTTAAVPRAAAPPPPSSTQELYY